MRACCWRHSMIARVPGNMGWSIGAMAPGDGGIGWLGVRGKAMDSIGNGTSTGFTCIGNGNYAAGVEVRGIGAGAGTGAAGRAGRVGGAAGATGGGGGWG